MQEEQTPLLGGRPTSILELCAKAVAVLTAASLATAFVFDSIRFLRLDERLLGVFVLSDHIETAISVLPWITVFTAVLLLSRVASPMSLFPPDLPREFPVHAKWMRRFILASIIFIVGLVVVSFHTHPWGRYDYRWEVLSVMLVAPALGYWTTRQGSLLKRSLMALPVVWVAITVIVAFGSANDTMRQLTAGPLQLPDTVILNDQGQLFGRVIKIVDKGVILARADPVLFMFIPKEKVGRVDLSNR